MMHDLMVGMFWAGLLMATPPIALGIGLLVFVVRQHRKSSSGGEHETS